MRRAFASALVFAVLAVVACSYDFDGAFAEGGIAPPIPSEAAADAPRTIDARSEPPDACPPLERGSALRPLRPDSTGALRHVATGGDDAADGTLERPWRTIQKASDTLAPGETAIVHEGQYTDDVRLTRSGSSTAPLTFRAADGETAVIRAPMNVAGSFVRVQGLVFDGTGNPLLVTGSDVDIVGCEVRSTTNTSIRLLSGDRVSVIGCRIHNGAGRGISVAGGSDALIANNIVVDHDGPAIFLGPNPQRTVVTQNTLVRNDHGVLLTTVSDDAGTVSFSIVVNNVMASNRTYGVALADGSRQRGTVVRNNLIFGSVGGAIYNLDSSSGTFEADPRFVSVPDDLHMGPDSIALGRALAEYSLPSDLDGACRPSGDGGADLGALEQ